jgi:hypothetical protein
VVIGALGESEMGVVGECTVINAYLSMCTAGYNDANGGAEGELRTGAHFPPRMEAEDEPGRELTSFRLLFVLVF